MFNCSVRIEVHRVFTDEKGNVVLYKGEQVDVVGASPQRGFMLVEHRGVSIHVPSHFLEVKVSFFVDKRESLSTAQWLMILRFAFAIL